MSSRKRKSVSFADEPQVLNPPEPAAKLETQKKSSASSTASSDSGSGSASPPKLSGSKRKQPSSSPAQNNENKNSNKNKSTNSSVPGSDSSSKASPKAVSKNSKDSKSASKSSSSSAKAKASSSSSNSDSRFNVDSMFAAHGVGLDGENDDNEDDEGDDFDDEGDEGDDEGDDFAEYDQSAAFADNLLDDDEDEGDEDDDAGDDNGDQDSAANKTNGNNNSGSGVDKNGDSSKSGDAEAGDGKVVKPMSQKRLLRLEQKLANRGVVYLSRIPPGMQPPKLRHLMSQFGEVGRVYLTPEDSAITRRRKKFRGKKQVIFVDGWVEFADKATAKAVARSLNNTKIGGKKRNYYHDDIWNIRYLKGFKWSHLTERLAYENKVRAQRLTHEVRQARQESEFYLERVQKAKNLEGAQAKKRQKLMAQGADAGALEQQLQPKLARKFKQRQLADEKEPQSQQQ